MKFSRNPVTGQMEIYTDEGVFAGIMSTMGDDFAEKAEDGGPGSGNYGHKGRPGKRGGSGPGGGKQYRGGRSDIGYFSSRKDWLNGLSGEKQHTAVRAIAKAKAEYNSKLAAKQKIESLANRGLLTFPEAEERIKEGKLDKIREGMPPEEYVLTSGTVKDRVDLMKYLKEARSWDETKGRMIADNLSEEEQQILNAFENNKEGVEAIMLGPAEMADQAAQIKDLLEAKAMGIIESDIEIPDDVQYALGTKEKPVMLPRNDKENKAWIERMDEKSDDFREINRIMDRVFHASIYNFAGRPNMNECEQAMILRTDLYGNEDTVWEAKHYLDLKDKNLGGAFYKSVQRFLETSGKEGGLKPSTDNAVLCGFLKDLAEEEKEKTGIDNTVGQIGDILEGGIFLDKSIPKDVKVAFLALKAQAMGMPVDGMSIEKYAERLQDYRGEREAANKRAKLFKGMSPEERVKLRYPEKVAGVSRRQEGDMNFEEADEGHTNPNYTPRSNYSKNCQTCVIAYEMRRRGYNVQAKGRKGDADSLQDQIAKNQNIAWIDPNTGQPPEFVKIERPLRNRNMARNWIEQTVKPGERYTFSFCWKDAHAAHVIIVERDNKGELMFFDPQIKPNEAVTKGDAITEYLGSIRVNSTSGGNWRPKLLRIDNALPNMDYCDRILLKSD